MRFTILIGLLLSLNISVAQNLDLVEGFYEILDHEMEHSRKMYLRGDSSMVYYIDELPVVNKYHRMNTQVGQDSISLYFYYNEEGTQRLMEYTSSHVGRKLGFIWLGALNKIYTIENRVDNGIIEFTSDKIYKINHESSYQE